MTTVVFITTSSWFALKNLVQPVILLRFEKLNHIITLHILFILYFSIFLNLQSTVAMHFPLQTQLTVILQRSAATDHLCCISLVMEKREKSQVPYITFTISMISITADLWHTIIENDWDRLNDSVNITGIQDNKEKKKPHNRTKSSLPMQIHGPG